jgi:hypothetical protein
VLLDKDGKAEEMELYPLLILLAVEEVQEVLVQQERLLVLEMVVQVLVFIYQ